MTREPVVLAAQGSEDPAWPIYRRMRDPPLFPVW
jgi:hypothetical protein